MPNGFSSNTGITSVSHPILFKLRCMLQQSLFWRLHPPQSKTAQSQPGLMMFLSRRFGIKVKGHPGLNRKNQVLALAPYLDLLDDTNISMLWEECNNRGWFATRKKLLDGRLLQSRLAQRIWNRDCAIKELDSMVEEKRQYWIDYWIDQHMKADVSWSEILTTLMVWLDARQSLEA